MVQDAFSGGLRDRSLNDLDSIDRIVHLGVSLDQFDPAFSGLERDDGCIQVLLNCRSDVVAMVSADI